MSDSVKKTDSIINLLFEAGLLKRVRRSGWWVVGIKDPESVAEHCFRCAVIGYALAKLEKADPYEVTLMCLFNDIHEARINDHHKMASVYFDSLGAENAAFDGQVADLPEPIGSELKKMRQDYLAQQSPESVIARDADILECLVQAKEYHDHGNEHAKLFFKKAPEHLKSKSARRLWRQLKKTDSSLWWQKISEFKR